MTSDGGMPSANKVIWQYRIHRITKMLGVLYIMFFALSIIGLLYSMILREVYLTAFCGIVFGYTYSNLFGRIWKEDWSKD